MKAHADTGSVFILYIYAEVIVFQYEKKTVRREAYMRWMNQPLPSFGSNHVDFGGIIIPASATFMISLTDTG